LQIKKINKLDLYMHRVGAGFRPGSFLSILNFMFMKINKIKSFVFGLAFLGSMAFGGISSQAQEDGEDPGLEGGCYARMVICGGGYNAYHCDGEPTGNRCGTYDKACFFC
jgi:hypothetical protein